MNKKIIRQKLKELKPILKEKFNVKNIGIFGSFAKNKATAESDIDIIVEFFSPVGWEFVDLNEFLEKELGRKVDLVTVRALKPELKKSILKETIYT